VGNFTVLQARIHNLKMECINNSLDCSAVILPMQIPTSVVEVTKDTMVFMFYWISIIHISNVTAKFSLNTQRQYYSPVAELW